MASPRLLYYADKANNQQSLSQPYTAPDKMDAPRGIAIGMWLSLPLWAGVALLFLLLVKW